MRVLQFKNRQGVRRVAAVGDGDQLRVLDTVDGIYGLSRAAISARCGLEEMATRHLGRETESYDAAAREGRLLPPIDHPDPAHLFVTGTGLTHLGSADTRDRMHKETQAAEELTDSMKMFRMGLEQGKPAEGETGVQPEWFYKGNGHSLVGPGDDLPLPAFASDGGEEPEIAGIYVIDDQGTPHRAGFALGNEYSDHVMERVNYLYLAPSKVRACSIGPELLIGELPADVQGMSRILRDGVVHWEKPFASGEANMSHTIANLEYHHFKYPIFRGPGSVHVHYFGTATLSFADGIRPRDGDVFEVECADFGRPLRNTLRAAPPERAEIRHL